MKKIIKKLEGTGRIEAFSDGIFAFSVTLLVLNIKIPPFDAGTNAVVQAQLYAQLPELVIFVFSFLVVAILWVNHHHFFHNCKQTDWKLLWYNNLLLFWTILLPFTTDLIGQHPFIPLVVTIYAAGMLMVAVSFMLMVRYVFFGSSLMEEEFSAAKRKMEFRKTYPAVLLYGLATGLAMWETTLALIIIALVPLLYFVPSVLHMEQEV